jgi:diphthamide synthase (EF-2-diphthine--ammonia ligase)
LVEVEIAAACSNDVYEQRMGQALAEAPLAEAQAIAFGDLFLADIRAYREDRLSRVGKEAIFPLWGRDTSALAREFIAAGFEAVLVCVDPRRLDRSFAGRRFDADLLSDLPPDVDSCGENGEFHTFVHAGPIFSAPIACQVGETVERDGFVFCDVLAPTRSSRLPTLSGGEGGCPWPAAPEATKGRRFEIATQPGENSPPWNLRRRRRRPGDVLASAVGQKSIEAAATSTWLEGLLAASLGDSVGERSGSPSGGPANDYETTSTGPGATRSPRLRRAGREADVRWPGPTVPAADRACAGRRPR